MTIREVISRSSDASRRKVIRYEIVFQLKLNVIEVIVPLRPESKIFSSGYNDVKNVTSSEFSRHEKICIEKFSCTKGSRYNFSFSFHLKEKPFELTFGVALI